MESNDKIVGHVGHKPLSIISDELDKLRERGIVIVDEDKINEINKQFEPEYLTYSKLPDVPEGPVAPVAPVAPVGPVAPTAPDGPVGP